MEEGRSWEQSTLISELIQGMELAKQLRLHVNAKSPAGTMDLLVHKILSSYEKSLMILDWSRTTALQQGVVVTSAVPESPISINGSPRSDDFDKDNHHENRNGSKKRKMLPRWTDQVKVNSENMLEGPHDDGYSWRKYGQKDILGTKYPRSYYRCTYRNTQNCWATKQVQRSDEDPTIFEVTYRGGHTCSYGNQTVLPPASPENKEQKPNNHHNNNNIGLQSDEMLLNLKKGLRVDTECLDNMAPAFSFPSTSFAFMESENPSFSPSALDNTSVLGSFSPTFTSPSTPELNYFTVSCQMNNLGSANTSATNSPILDLDFSLDPVELDPNFPFDAPGLFS